MGLGPRVCQPVLIIELLTLSHRLGDKGTSLIDVYISGRRFTSQFAK